MLSITHTFTHLRPKYAEMIPEKGLMGAAMTEFDDTVGALTRSNGRARNRYLALVSAPTGQICTVLPEK